MAGGGLAGRPAAGATATAGGGGAGGGAVAASLSGDGITGSFSLRKARALAVCPLHTSFSFTPPQAPHILDVRTAAREAVPLTAALPPVAAAGLCSPTATPRSLISGCVLVFDDANVAAQAAMHIELARRRIVGGKLDAILRLETAPWADAAR
jgi:hypothetical protein